MKIFKKTKFKFSDSKSAINKLIEKSNGKNFKIDIKPYKGIEKETKHDFLVIKEKGVWYLRICKIN